MQRKNRAEDLSSIQSVADSSARVTGFTHDFYNYPARFSPLFAKELICQFTRPGDLVLDPFMGGGTTLIEARLQNRLSVGFDISSLASFLTTVKLNPIKTERFDFFKFWLTAAIADLSCHKKVEIPEQWIARNYFKNLDSKETWPVRKLIEQLLSSIEEAAFGSEAEMNFLRCVILKTAQWAFDSKKIIPNVKSFKAKLISNYSLMTEGTKEYWNSNIAIVFETAIAVIIRCVRDD